jgi:hypothetical protein
MPKKSQINEYSDYSPFHQLGQNQHSIVLEIVEN